MLTILRLASVIGVVSIGMTFVIIGGGIDLSVGAIVALSSVWSTTVATQTMAEDTHWSLMVLAALAVGTGCGLVNGLLIAYGRIAPFIATLAMLAAARGLAEIIAERQTQIVDGARLRATSSAAGSPRRPRPGHHLRGRRGDRLGAAQPDHLRTTHAGRRWQRRSRAARRHRRAPPDGHALHPARSRLRHRRRDARRSHDHRQLDARDAPTSSTRSPPSSSAAPCSAAAAAPSSAPSSVC